MNYGCIMLTDAFYIVNSETNEEKNMTHIMHVHILKPLRRNLKN